MSSEFGKKLIVQIFGESHGTAVGATVDSFPAGEEVDMDELMRFMERRRGGKALTTKRNEADVPVILSGLTDGKTNAFPLTAIIYNLDVRSGDYDALKSKPRPSHADLTAYIKWHGMADMRGGGHFSGRLTAPLCAVGGIAKQILARRGIFVGAHLSCIGTVRDAAFPLLPDEATFRGIAEKSFPVIDDEAGETMQNIILDAATAQDSVGGIVECAAIGLPAGVGSPMFDGVENRLSQAIFGIPAVRGVEFGSGFGAAYMMGSENNDPIVSNGAGEYSTQTNNNGGVQGGITNGMPIVLRVAIKPTPSIGLPQNTIEFSSGKNAELALGGRHDPCVALRAVPAVEAVTALVLLDMLMEDGSWK